MEEGRRCVVVDNNVVVVDNNNVDTALNRGFKCSLFAALQRRFHVENHKNADLRVHHIVQPERPSKEIRVPHM